MPGIHDIIVRPLITEKSSAAFQNKGEYTFMVHPQATKLQIRQALEQLFEVTPVQIRTMQVRRREVTRGRIRGKTARWKKAIVLLKEGDQIPVFEG